MSRHNSVQNSSPRVKKFFPMFNGRVVPKQQTQNHEITYVSASLKNKLQRSQNIVNTIKTAIRVRAQQSRENLITILYKHTIGVYLTELMMLENFKIFIKQIHKSYYIGSFFLTNSFEVRALRFVSLKKCNHCKRVNNKFKKSYDLPLDLL